MTRQASTGRNEESGLLPSLAWGAEGICRERCLISSADQVIPDSLVTVPVPGQADLAIISSLGFLVWGLAPATAFWAFGSLNNSDSIVVRRHSSSVFL